MNRESVRAVMGQYEEFKKGDPRSPITTDDFIKRHAHAYYDIHSVVKGVELFAGSGAHYKGLDVFSLDADGLVAALEEQGLVVLIDDCGMAVQGKNVEFYCPDVHEIKSAKICSIYVSL